MRKPVRRGPIPKPNSEAGTLHERAASKWPSSWTIMARAVNPMSEIISDITKPTDVGFKNHAEGFLLRKSSFVKE
jgi:hypothetical protein